MPPKNNKGKDARFATLQTDPRFRKTKAKQLKVEVDDRFKAVLDEGGVFAKEASGSKGAYSLVSLTARSKVIYEL
jgi:galactose-1-phosphate uridylyltransferase